jgi:hypothetical protein
MKIEKNILDTTTKERIEEEMNDEVEMAHSGGGEGSWRERERTRAHSEVRLAGAKSSSVESEVDQPECAIAKVKKRVPIEVQKNARGQVVCSARSRSRPGDYCRSTAVYANGRCKNHGGPTPGGIAHPGFKNGAASKHLPTRLLSKYQEALNDPELGSLENELALVQARTNDLLSSLDEGGTSEIFFEIDEAVQAFQCASSDNDRKGMRESWRRLENAVKRGKSEAAAWEEIGSKLELKRKLSVSQARRQKDLEHLVPVEKANSLIAALLAAVRENVADKGALAKINETFRRYIQTGTSEGRAS